MRFNLIVLFISLVPNCNLLAQSKEHLPEAKRPSLEVRYHAIKSESQTFVRNDQIYKVVKENVLEAFWRSVKDSLHQRQRYVAKANTKIDTLTSQKNTFERLLTIQNASMQEVLFDSKHITILGIPFSKGVFIVFFSVLIGSLGFSLCAALTRVRYTNRMLKENMRIMESVSNEYKLFKKKSLERQAKLSRQLQDERNKLNVEGNSKIDWSSIAKTHNDGEMGTALSQTLQFEGLRIRLVEYSAGYMADWSNRGHLVHCLEGEFVSELENGNLFTLTKGMTYVVSDHLNSQRSVTKQGVKLLMIDGDFLRLNR